MHPRITVDHPIYSLTEPTISALLRSYPSSPLFGSPYGTGSYMPQRWAELGTQFKRVASLMGDVTTTAGRRFIAELNAAREQPTFSYRFDAIPWEIPAYITRVPNSVAHYSEVRGWLLLYFHSNESGAEDITYTLIFLNRYLSCF